MCVSVGSLLEHISAGGECLPAGGGSRLSSGRSVIMMMITVGLL